MIFLRSEVSCSLNDYPDLKGIETGIPEIIRASMSLNDYPDLKGIETLEVLVSLLNDFRLNDYPDLKGIETFVLL